MSEMKTRREVLVDGLRAAGLLTAAGLIGPEAILAAAKKKAAAKGFFIGACDWTIKLGGSPAALDLAKKLGLDGLQVDVGQPGKMAPLKPEVQKVYRAKMKETGMKVSTLALGTLNSNPYVSEKDAQQWVADTIAGCKGLGATGILLAFFGKGDLRKDPKDVETLIAKLKENAPQAEKAKVKLLIESMLPAETLMKIVDAVASPAVGVYYDVANTQQVGYDIVKEIKMLGKHIGEFHAKDRKALYGREGCDIDFPAVRQAMDEIGYRGWIHIEGTQFPLGLDDSIRADAEYLRTVFPKQA